VVLRFSWLSPTSCVTSRRGPDAAEQLSLVLQADGSFYVDVRGAFEPAVLRVNAQGCEGG
jgi:hypothetical protein